MPNDAPRLAPAGAGRILIVDDELVVRDLLVRWLTEQGYACATAANADEAREQLRRHAVHAMTLDIHMPGASGVDLLREVVRLWPDTAVIMLTAVDNARTAVESLARGAAGYLIKPVELLFQVKMALERRQLILEKREYTRRLEQKVREQTRAIRRGHEETIHRLVAAAMYRDQETGAHVRRTGLLSEVLAEAAGWSAAAAEEIRLAAPMHDVGKIGIPDAILRKPGKLTPREFEVMKTHTLIGAEMLADSEMPMLRAARQIALSHHEWWDGGGYPHGLSGADIPEGARIVAIVDAYDALTHDRVYRPALPEDEALAVLQKGVGRQFDPLLCATFFSILPDIRGIAEANPDEPAAEATSSALPRPETTRLLTFA